MSMSRLVAGRGVALRPRLWLRESRGRRVMLVSEPGAWRRWGRGVLRGLAAAGARPSAFLLPPGEAAKSWPPVSALLRRMLARGLGRDGCLIALGGGAVTDAAGFAAAIYMRGIPWVSAPTTLLGQLDGGIGGKTAINLPEGKNLAGAFHQPEAVVCDADFLKTLPRRERISGLAEALKCGLVFDPGLWRRMLRRWEELADGEPALTGRVIGRAAGWKLRVVARDERETRGIRDLLNFGHTLGHAFETAAKGKLRHGEAVVWGMRAALRLSVRNAGLAAAAAAEADCFLQRICVPLPPGLSPRALLKIAARDKKARGGRLRWVLLAGIGQPVVTNRVTARGASSAALELLSEAR